VWKRGAPLLGNEKGKLRTKEELRELKRKR
jgi:hypothetical protein